MDVGLLLQSSQYAIPVGIVLVCAILVFVFGFKKAEQPPFAQLSSAPDPDRKLATKKRGKTREKRSANGQVTAEKPSPAKKTATVKTETSKKSVVKVEEVDGKLKERKQDENKVSVNRKEKEVVSSKTGKENKAEQTKNKKNLKNLFQEKPVDFDDGEWEQAYSKKDKKKKKEDDSPSKKNKKPVKKNDLINEVVAKQEPEKTEIKDKDAKETENKELKEKEKKNIVLTPVSNEEVVKEKKLPVEKEKEEQRKAEKVEKIEKKKSKKSKKTSEGESTPTSVPSTPKTESKTIEQPVPKKIDNAELIVDNTEEQTSVQAAPKTGVVIEELGDTWTEAKAQKKSKKKARKDN